MPVVWALCCSGVRRTVVTVFSDGLALFESYSGDLTTWLTTEEGTYSWVC
jgi:hypothetical protein